MFWLGFLLSVVSWVLVIVNWTMASTVIVELGIGTYRILNLVAMVSAGAGGLMIVGGLVKKANHESKIAIERADDLIEKAETLSLEYAQNPRYVRQQLKRFEESKDYAVRDLVDKCVGQLDLMDKRQAQMNELLRLNNADYLRDLNKVLDDTELRICQNIKKIVNMLIIADDDSFEEDSVDHQMADKYLKDNSKILNQCRELLWQTRDYINNQGDQEDVSVIQAYIETLKQSLREVER